MKVGVIGLGRMGMGVAYRLIKAGHDVIGFDPGLEAQHEAKLLGVECVATLADLGKDARIVWMMVPAGKPVDDVLSQLEGTFQVGDIIIDGGNSFFKDSVRRHDHLKTKEISFLDCGTSGGLHGKTSGYCLMIGGDTPTFDTARPVFEAIAAPSGYEYVGQAGAGHYVKMVHNGIEYALLQAYAEGFHMLKEGPYKDLDLEKISGVWNHGSIVRSWIVELAKNVFERDQDFADVSGNIGENMTGKWTIEQAHELKIPVPLIEEAVNVRAWSRQTGGNYATKLVALLRHEFGGHPIKKIDK